MIRYLTVLLFIFISSEKIEYKLLADGFTKVPADENYFTKNYRENDKFKVSLPDGVQTNVLYLPAYAIIGGRKTDNLRTWPEFYSEAYLFYENGCVNVFKPTPKHPDLTLDPAHQGYRGICYKKKKKTIIAMYLPYKEDFNVIKERPYEISVKGDTLFVHDVWMKYDYVYIKDKSGIKTNNSANW